MSNREYGPSYFIRIFTADGEVNLSNVISISTTKDVNAETGAFTILLDYNQNPAGGEGVNNTFNAVTFKQDSIFFQVKPMDYIEIYMAREIHATGQEASKGQIPKIGKDGGFGVYDKDGSFIRNFDQAINSNGEYTTLDKKYTESLNIVDRVLNPHLVFCGFVDGVSNSFGLTENSTSNNIQIRGKCLAKFLAVHHLFFNFPYAEIFFTQIQASIDRNGLRANEAVDLILTKFCWEIFSDKQIKLKESELDDREMFKEYEKTDFPGHKVVYGEGDKSNYFSKIIHNAVPSFKYMYWGTNIESAAKFAPRDSKKRKEYLNTLTPKNGYFKWGRMEYQDSINRNNLNIDAENSVLSILRQGAQLPFNEFFVDEIGNIVLRQTLDAWDYTRGLDTSPRGKNESLENYLARAGEILDDPDVYIKDWAELSQGDIKSWNFDISDDELKTIVMSIPTSYVLGLQPIMAGGIGVAPISRLNSDVLLDNTKKKSAEEKAIKQKDQVDSSLERAVKTIEAQQNNHLDEYDLSTDAGILRFWARYGLRPIKINDIYSDSPTRHYMSAWALFQKYANYWWKGTFLVKGDSKYKAGQKVKIKDFGLDEKGFLRDFNCYVQGVSQNFVWGQEWTTTLNFTRGEIEGTVTAQKVSPVK